MQKSFSLMLLAVALCLTTGCARNQQQGLLFSDQQEMQTVDHWNVLANDVANRINTELMRQHYLNTPVYVRHSCGKPNPCGPGQTFPFDEGFNDLLTTQLVNFGINTVAAPEGAGLVVDYKVHFNASSMNSDHYEVIVTTFIIDKNKYVMRSSNIYAIDKADFWQYRQPSPATEIELVGPGGASRPLKAKSSL